LVFMAGAMRILEGNDGSVLGASPESTGMRGAAHVGYSVVERRNSRQTLP